MSSKELRNKKREYITSKKRVPCADCGCEYPIKVMDFHHIDEETKAEKLKKPGRSMIFKMEGWSYDKIDEELNKCVVLCANCHRLRH